MAPLNQESGSDFQAKLEAPALQPPPGITSNFVDPPNRSDYAYAALIVCVSVVSGFAILRAYARIFYMKKVHLADCKRFGPFGARWHLANSSRPGSGSTGTIASLGKRHFFEVPVR
jgi:hypothetical protein